MPPVPKLRLLESQQAAKRSPRPKKGREATGRPQRRVAVDPGRRPGAEAVGVVLLFGALLSGAMLAGWHPRSGLQGSTGPGGGAFAHALMSYLGLVAFLIPPLLLIGGSRLLAYKSLRLRGGAAGSVLVLSLAVAGLLDVLDHTGRNPLAPELPQLGGALGALVAAPFLALLRPLGATIVLLAVFCSVALYAFSSELRKLVVLVHLAERMLAWFGGLVLRILVASVNGLLAIGPALSRLRSGLRSLAEGPIARLRQSLEASPESDEDFSPAWSPPVAWAPKPAPRAVGAAIPSGRTAPGRPEDPAPVQLDDPEPARLDDAASARLDAPVPARLEKPLAPAASPDPGPFEPDFFTPEPPIILSRSVRRTAPDPGVLPLDVYDEMDDDEPLEPLVVAETSRTLALAPGPPVPGDAAGAAAGQAPLPDRPAGAPDAPLVQPGPELSDEDAIEAALTDEPDLFAGSPAWERELAVAPIEAAAAEDPDEAPLEDLLPAYAPAGFSYRLPELGLLAEPPPEDSRVLEEELRENSRLLLSKLGDFGVQGAITCIRPGPVITRYEFEPAPGTRINKIIGLSDDLALALKAVAAPRVAPIPKSSALGIELPNHNRETVHFKSIVASEAYEEHPSLLRLALGVDIAGHPYVADLARMPHLLIAGATGSGKSVCINTLLLSLLMNANPEQVQLLLIDPKMLELSIYNDVPHLLEDVVTEPKKAAAALAWAVREMEARYKKLSRRKVRSIGQYNEVVEREPIAAPTRRDPDPQVEYPLPYIVIIIDELADLMMVSGNEVETSITRLAQMARAAGIHLILATQRPSVDVITGSIKANFPCRISFKVASKVDSRTVLDGNGAEKLLGRGDMFFIAPGTSAAMRIHGCYLSEDDILRVVEHWKPQPPVQRRGGSIFEAPSDKADGQDFAQQDDLYEPAVRFIVESGHASISLLQRRLRVGHARAARLIDMMEQDGVVGGFEGSKTREVLWKPEQLPENYGV